MKYQNKKIYQNHETLVVVVVGVFLLNARNIIALFLGLTKTGELKSFFSFSGGQKCHKQKEIHSQLYYYFYKR